MSDIYVFGPNELSNDYSTMGLVGALTPTKCEFTETGNEESSLTLTHPIDGFGRYMALQRGNIIVACVPVRTTPEIQNGKIVTTVWSYKVKPLNQLTSKNQRTLYKKQTGSSKKKVMNAGDIITVVQKSEDDSARWKAKTKYGTGWVDPNGFELITEHVISDNSNSIEEIQSPWSMTPQYYRILDVDKGFAEITVFARHISYDLLYNVTRYESAEEVNLQTALDGILGSCYADHDFSAYTNVDNVKAGLFYRGLNPINAISDPEKGICAQFNVKLVRDNYDLYFLHDPGMNRGVRIQYGKNMTGIKFKTSEDSVATRIVPIGEKKNGDPLDYKDPDTGLPYIDSNIINSYSVIHVHELKCENCKVGDKDTNGSTVTESIAQRRMQAQAKALLQNGCDQPTIEMSVEFVNLGDTEEYAQFRNLENCFLYDYVIVQHPTLDIDVTAQIVSYTWDCIRDRMISVQIGSVGHTLANSGITSWQIPSGFSGSKIAGNTIGGSALKSDIISTRHIQSESVNTSALQAGSVTADKIATGTIDAIAIEAITAKFNEIVTGEITTDELYAAIAKIMALEVGSITADNIDTDALAAVLGEFVKIYAEYAGLDFATIKDLTADEFIFRLGVAGEVYIDRLAVTSANIIAAVLGEMVLKGDDGKYYRLHVQADGTITTEQIEVTDGEIASGTTSGGQTIIETTANIRDLNAQTIKGSSAIITEIFTDALTAGEITAGQAMIASATIPELSATVIKAIGDSIDISANSTIQLLIQSNDLLRSWFTFSDEGMRAGKQGSTYSTLVNDVGFHVLQQDEIIGSFARRALHTEAVRIGKASSTEPRIVMREAPDGGMMITLEEVTS